MIEASKAKLLTNFNLESVFVRQVEMEYFLMVFGKLSLVAGVVAGFAAAGLSIPPSKHGLLNIFHLLATGASFGWNL